MKRERSWMATFPAVLGAVLWAIGIWIIVYGFLLKGWGYGLLFILAGTALLLVSVGVLRTRGSGHVRSFWVFDRPEKDKWEDVDRVIRR